MSSNSKKQPVSNTSIVPVNAPIVHKWENQTIYGLVGQSTVKIASIEYKTLGSTAWKALDHTMPKGKLFFALSELEAMGALCAMDYILVKKDGKEEFKEFFSGKFEKLVSISAQIDKALSKINIPTDSKVTLFGAKSRNSAMSQLKEVTTIADLRAEIMIAYNADKIAVFSLLVDETGNMSKPFTLRNPDSLLNDSKQSFTVGKHEFFVIHDSYADKTRIYSDNFDFEAFLLPDKERVDGSKRPSIKIDGKMLFRGANDNKREIEAKKLTRWAWVEGLRSTKDICFALSDHIRYETGTLTVNGEAVNKPVPATVAPVDPTAPIAIDTRMGAMWVKQKDNFTLVKCADNLALEIIKTFGLPTEKQSENGTTVVKYETSKVSFKQLDEKFAQKLIESSEGSLLSEF